MGCGASTSNTAAQTQNGGHKVQNGNDAKIANGIPKQKAWSEAEQENQSNSFRDEETRTITNTETERKRPRQETRDLTEEVQEHQGSVSDTNDKTEAVRSPLGPAVAFKVPLGGGPRELKRPHKLKKLESITSLTAEMLAHKQAAAEMNRQKELDKKVKKTSKRRQELLQARELDKSQQQRSELDDKIKTKEQNRAKVKAEVIAKQKRREERAKRVRERAKKIQQGEDAVDFTVDPDETYYADRDDESWDLESSAPNSATCSNRHSPDPEKQQTMDETEDKTNNNNEVHDFFE